eukprot:m.167000 g.167000  ORF g.167000 m.167000 type:complete len:705 (-) comp18180_c0_seq3:123-2237(-)
MISSGVNSWIFLVCTVILLCVIYYQESLNFSGTRSNQQIHFPVRNPGAYFSTQTAVSYDGGNFSTHETKQRVGTSSWPTTRPEISTVSTPQSVLATRHTKSKDDAPTERNSKGLLLHRLPMEALGVTQDQLHTQVSLAQDPTYALAGVYTASVLGQDTSHGDRGFWKNVHLAPTVRCEKYGVCFAFGNMFSVQMIEDKLCISNSSYCLHRSDLPKSPYGNYIFSFGSAKLYWRRTYISVKNVFKQSKTPRSKGEKDAVTELGKSMCKQLNESSHEVWKMTTPRKFQEGSDVNDVRCPGKNGMSYSMNDFVAPRSQPFSRTIVDYWPSSTDVATIRWVVQFGDTQLGYYRTHGRVIVTAAQKLLLLNVAVEQGAAGQQPAPVVWTSLNCTDAHPPPRRFRSIVPNIQHNPRCMENPTVASKRQWVYVAMTTIAKKLEEIQRTLTSLAMQTHRPDGVLVTVPERSYRYPDVVSTVDLASSTLETHGLNVTIVVSPVDMGPASRYFGAVHYLYHAARDEHPDLDPDNTWLVTLDTDNAYNQHGIQVLLDTVLSNTTVPRVRSASFAANLMTSYPQRKARGAQSADMFLHRLCEFRDVATWPRPPHCFFVDDTWVNAMHNIVGSPPSKASNRTLVPGLVWSSHSANPSAKGLLSERGTSQRSLDVSMCATSMYETFCTGNCYSGNGLIDRYPHNGQGPWFIDGHCDEE